MKIKLLIVETTKEERENIIADACALGSLSGQKLNSEEKAIFKQYIDGLKEIDDIEAELVGL